MPDTIHLITNRGRVYSSLVGSGVSTAVASCWVNPDFQPCGLAVSPTNILVLKNLAEGQVLAVYNRNGEFLRSLLFDCDHLLLGLCLWPGRSDLLASTYDSGVTLLFVTSTAVSFHNIGVDFTPQGGISAKNPNLSNPISASFYCGSNGKIVTTTIDRLDLTSTASENFCRRLHTATTSLASNDTKAYGIHQANGQSILHTFEQGIPTTGVQKKRVDAFPIAVVGMAVSPAAGAVEPAPAASADDVTVVTRQYNADGTSREEVAGVNFGAVRLNDNSDVVCVDLLVKNAKSISNVKIGLVTTTNVDFDQFKMSHQTTFSDTITPATPFPGLSDGTPESPNNLAVGTRIGEGGKINASDFVFLMANAKTLDTIGEPANCVYMWFFDYEV